MKCQPGWSTSWNQDSWEKYHNLRYADDTTLLAESEEELKSLLLKVKEESERVGLKPNIQKMKIMASCPITSWEIDGETVETVSDFIFLGSKITADGDCSHEIKRRLLLGRKVMTNLDSIFKNRDIILLTKVCLVKAMVFPVVMYGCESWTVKKAGESEVAQSCLTLCDPVDCNLLGFSVHGILQARILEWISISFSRGSSQPRDQIRVSRIGGRHFNLWATREALSAKELMLLNCGVGEDSWESLGLQGDPTSPFWRRSTLGFLWKEWF